MTKYSIEEIEDYLGNVCCSELSVTIIRQLLAERKEMEEHNAELKSKNTIRAEKIDILTRKLKEIRRQAFDEAADVADHGYEGYGKNLPSTRAICMTIADSIRRKAEED